MRIHKLEIGHRALQGGQFLGVIRRCAVMREERSRSDEKCGSHSKKEKGPRFHGTPLELARISHCHVRCVNAKFTEGVGQANMDTLPNKAGTRELGSPSPLANTVYSLSGSMRPSPRAPEKINHFPVEGGDIVRLPAGDEIAVDNHFFVLPLRAGITQIRLEGRPG